ncbi:6389_t:CDS:2, partial [Scutellospora calospora]
NLEFENLLSRQDRSLFSNLSGAPFLRSNPPAYVRRANMVVPEDPLLDDDGENLQTQDAEFLPDEQIDKFSERVKCHPVTDAQLAAEEEEARRQEEEEIRRKRHAATQAALAKEYTDSSRTIMHDSSSAESSSKSRKITPHDEDSQVTSLNKPRNPHERLFVQDINMEDYDDVTDFEDISNNQRPSDSLLARRHTRRSLRRDNEQKMEDYSPFSVSILRSDDYDTNQEDYSPTVGDEEIEDPFENILPDFSERLGNFFNRLTNSGKLKKEDTENICLTGQDDNYDDISLNKNNTNLKSSNNGSGDGEELSIRRSPTNKLNG